MPVQVASIQTLAKRLTSTSPASVPSPPDLLIIDEAHRAAAPSYRKVIQAWPNAFVVGLSATPARTDGRGLDDIFADLVTGPSVADLIQQGHLARYRLFAPGVVDMTGAKSRLGDYAAPELDERVNKSTVTGDAVSHYLKLARGKRAIVFCVSVKHAENVLAAFRTAGVPSDSIDGATSHAERRARLERFRTGQTLVLVSIQLAIEGLDIPEIEAAIILRPTQSLIVHMQTIGRALRPAPNKPHALIIDHCGNWQRHGLPDDPREWTLKGRDPSRKRRAQDETDLKIRQCSKCYRVLRVGERCPDARPDCPLATANGRVPEHVEGELAEVDLDALRRERRREEGRAQTFEDLVRIGKERGYRDGWAHFRWQARQRRYQQRGSTQ